MSELEEFIKKTREDGNNDGDFKELQDILNNLDVKPKIVYRSYDVISNT